MITSKFNLYSSFKSQISFIVFSTFPWFSSILSSSNSRETTDSYPDSGPADWDYSTTGVIDFAVTTVFPGFGLN